PAAVRRHVLDATQLDPEPVSVQRTHHGHQDGPVQFGIEPRVRVELVVTLDPPSQEVRYSGQPVDPFTRDRCVVWIVHSRTHSYPPNPAGYQSGRADQARRTASRYFLFLR